MKKVALVAPSPIKGSGGVARIYNFAQALGKNGYDCHVYVFDSGQKSAAELSVDAAAYYDASGFSCHTSDEAPSGEFGLAIATRWDTAATVKRIDSPHKAYLVQDYEVCFNPVGDGSVLAENSYLMGLQPLTYGRWLAFKLRSEFGNSPYYFEFASDGKAFRCEKPMAKRLEENPKIVFVYQGDKTRRCPRLGIEALGIVKHMRPDVDLYFVGSNQPPVLWYDFKNVGNLTIEKLNELYNECHVGVSLSSSNPSCNPFDMMASGLPSVDLYRENNLFDTPAGGVLLAHQTPESIAEAILHLLSHPDELLARSRFGVDFMRGRSQDREVESFLEAVSAMLEGRAQGASQKSLLAGLYDKPPVIAEINRDAFSQAYVRNQWRSVQQVARVPLGKGAVFYPTDELGIGRSPQIRERKLDAVERLVSGYAKKRPLYDRYVRRLLKRFGGDPRLNMSLFDVEFYLRTNGDVREAGVDPFRHFVQHGVREGRLPSPYFDAIWYADKYATTIEHGEPPVLHYVLHGSAIGQAPNPWFDPIWYLARNLDARPAGHHPLLHYLETGEPEMRDPSERFSVSWYKSQYPDVAASNWRPLQHFIVHGREENRQPVPPVQAYRREGWQHAGREVAGVSVSLFAWKTAEADFEPAQPRIVTDILEESDLDCQVSFDVWNTIIHRRCHPDEIKLRSARILKLLASDDIAPGFRSIFALMRARMRAENASAPHGDFEYRFDDAVGSWLRDVLLPSCDATRRADLAKKILAHELAAETASIELDENAGKAIRALRRAPIFISDFYMASPFVNRLLDSVGVGGYFAHGYVSCDGFENKRSGALFHKVLADYALKPEDLVHVGDNPVADFERPVSLGIRAVPYVSAAEEVRNAWYSEAFYAMTRGDNSLHERRMLGLVARHASEDAPSYGTEDAALYRAGCQIGLLAFGYCLNIMQDAIMRGAKEVVFFAREGIVLKAIYDLLAEHNPFNTICPPSKLLFVSRRATFAASLKSYDNTEMMRLWTMYWRQSPAAFAASLNLDASIAALAAGRVGIAADDVIAMPWADERFQAFLQDAIFRKHAVHEIARQRDMLQRYVAQELSAGQDEVLIADIGWRGTIQDNLAHLLGKPVHGHYLALFGYLNDQPRRSSKTGWLSDTNTPGDYSLPDQVAPLEMIFNGPGGSTIGYRETERGRIEPVREVFAGEEAVVDALAPCRAGMMAVVPSLARYVQLHGLMAEDLLSLNRKLAEDIITAPPAAIADMFGRLEHNETFGVGAVEAMQERPFNDVVRKPAGPELHGALSSFLGQRWRQGMVRQTEIGSWWDGASFKERASAPLPILRAASPAIVKAAGSRLAVYIPEPLAGSGGFRTIFNMVRKLVDVGFNAELHVEGPSSKYHIIEEYLGDTPAAIFRDWTSHRNATVAFATVANSAAYVQSHVSADCRAYLVQDSEAIFHPMGDNFISAENSYALGLSHITVGNWLTHMINTTYASPAYPAGFGVDREQYRIVDGIAREDAVCMLYQPEKPRRGNDMALKAMALLKRRNPEVNIYLYGSEIAPSTDFDFEHLGLIRDLGQINALYNCCKAGLCISLSNPSRIPFEMAAAGCKPVDVYRYNNLMDYTDAMGVLAYQSAESIAYALEREVSAGGAVEQSAAETSTAIASRTQDWEGDAMVAYVLALLNGDSCARWDLNPSYAREAVIAPKEDNPAVREFCRRQLISAQAR